MSCPTCDHTMQHVAGRAFWCPRCGTVATLPVSGEAGPTVHQAPKLVERCRSFRRLLGTAVVDEWSPTFLASHWRTIGVEESINKPEDRPQ